MNISKKLAISISCFYLISLGLVYMYTLRHNPKLEATREDLRATREDLEATREDLRATREDLEATREDLEATREDLEATREDLEATREDLEATREELKKVEDRKKKSFEYIPFKEYAIVATVTAVITIMTCYFLRNKVPTRENEIENPTSHLVLNLEEVSTKARLHSDNQELPKQTENNKNTKLKRGLLRTNISPSPNSPELEITPEKKEKNSKAFLKVWEHEDDIDAVKKLLNLSSSKIDFNVKNYEGKTPFWIACNKKKFKVVKLLLEKGKGKIDFNIPDKLDTTPFEMVCIEKNSKIAGLLLEKGKGEIDFNIQDSLGRTPFWNICVFGDLKIVKKLLLYSNEINFDIPNKKGETAFWATCDNGNFAIVTELLKHKINFNIKNQHKKAPLDVIYDKMKILKKNSQEWNTWNIIWELMKNAKGKLNTYKDKEGKEPPYAWWLT